MHHSQLDPVSQLIPGRENPSAKQLHDTNLLCILHLFYAAGIMGKSNSSGLPPAIALAEPSISVNLVKNPLASQVDAENKSSSFREESRFQWRDEAIRHCASREYRVR
jgi:hypothetical protein